MSPVASEPTVIVTVPVPLPIEVLAVPEVLMLAVPVTVRPVRVPNVVMLVEPAQVERAVSSTFVRPTWDLERLVNNEPFNAGRYPEVSSLTSWETPLNVFPCVVTAEFKRAVLIVPVVAELIAVIAD